MKTFKEHGYGLESKGKPPSEEYHQKLGRTYFCPGHQAFICPFDQNAIILWRTRFYYQSKRWHSFVIRLPYSTFFFTRPTSTIVEDKVTKIPEEGGVELCFHKPLLSYWNKVYFDISSKKGNFEWNVLS